MSEDAGNLAVVEAMLVAVVLFGSVLFVLYSPMPGDEVALETAGTGPLADDLLRVLSRTPSENGYDSILDEMVSTAVLDDTDMAATIARRLPAGAGFGLYLDNGVKPTTLYESGSPIGEVTTSGTSFYPGWDFDLVFATAENHSASSAADTLTLRAVHVANSYRATPSWPIAAVFTTGNHATFSNEGQGRYVASAIAPDAWVPGGYASTATQAYAVTVNGTSFPATYRVDPGHPALDATLKAWADAGGHATATPTAYPGDTVTLTYDLTAVAGATARKVTVYGPAPGLVAARADIGPIGTWSYVVPRDALYGTYTVDTRITFPSGTLQQTLHDVTTFDILRPGTTGASPPVYRVVLAVWFNAL